MPSSAATRADIYTLSLHDALPICQRLRQVLLVLHKYQSARLRLCDAGDGRDFEVAVADQAGASEFRQRLQSLRHEVVIGEESGTWLVASGSFEFQVSSFESPRFKCLSMASHCNLPFVISRGRSRTATERAFWV